MLRILRILNALQDNQRRSCRCGTSKEVGRKKREERREKREERRDENADHPIIRSSDHPIATLFVRLNFTPSGFTLLFVNALDITRITHYTLHIPHDAAAVKAVIARKFLTILICKTEWLEIAIGLPSE
jgi:hypothetical protein